jgi:hypothetical protein
VSRRQYAAIIRAVFQRAIPSVSIEMSTECGHGAAAILGHHVGHQSLKLHNVLAPGAAEPGTDRKLADWVRSWLRRRRSLQWNSNL